MSLRVYYEILNQRGTPAIYTDTFANRPAFGFQGRLFVSTDSGQIFEDTGTAWTLVADAGVGGGTLSSVCLNGNTTASGIVITANGLSSNSITNTSLTTGSILFAGASGLESQNNTKLFWDNTNFRLGIGNNTPGALLDIHGSGSMVHINGTGANNSYLLFQNAGTGKWRIGNTYSTGSNYFEIYDVLNSVSRFTMINSGFIGIGQQNALPGYLLSLGSDFGISAGLISNIKLAVWDTSVNTNTAGFGISPNLFEIQAAEDIAFFNGFTSSTRTERLRIASNGATTIKSSINGSSLTTITGNTNFLTIQSTLGGQTVGLKTISTSKSYFCGQNYSVADNFEIYDLTSSASRLVITTGGNLLIGTTTDNGIKFQVNGDTYASGYVYFKNQASSNNFAIYGSTNILVYNSSVGNIASINATTGIYTPTSDFNKKKDFEASTIGLKEVLQLKPTLYRMKSENDSEKHLGFIAQEVKEFIPQAYDEKDEFIGLDFNAITTANTKAIQEIYQILVRNNII
jgi:hypothetical protein